MPTLEFKTPGPAFLLCCFRMLGAMILLTQILCGGFNTDLHRVKSGFSHYCANLCFGL